jgi:hypothetical protein
MEVINGASVNGTPNSFIEENQENKKLGSTKIIWITVLVVLIILVIVGIALAAVYASKSNNKHFGMAKDKFLNLMRKAGDKLKLKQNNAVDVKITDWKNGIISPIQVTETEKEQIKKKYENNPEFYNSTIMVSICSYRDPELCLTLRDLLEKATNPSRLSICITEQNDPNDEDICHAKTILTLPNLPIKPEQLRVQSFMWKEARGPTWARSLNEKQWKGEKYYLMIDSHSRVERSNNFFSKFLDGWDCELIENLWLTPRPFRTVLSMYPEGYEANTKGDAITYKIPYR